MTHMQVLAMQFPREIARRAKAMKITTEAQLHAWAVESRSWMTHLAETEALRQGLTDEERTKLADQMATAFNEQYLDLYRTVAGRVSA